MNDSTPVVQKLDELLDAIRSIEYAIPDVSDIESRLRKIENLVEKIERNSRR